MRTSVIWRRVADFLKQHPPFEYLSEAELLDVASSGRVTFHQSEEEIYRAGGTRRESIWVIQQGTVQILDPGGKVVDLLGAGGILGLHTFVTTEPYTTTARTASDVILYALDAKRLVPMVRHSSEALRFLNTYFSTHGGYALHAEERRSWFEEDGPPLALLARRDLPSELPKVAVPAGRPVGDYLLAAIRANADSVAVTEGERVVTVLTSADLAICAGRDVLTLFRAMGEAADGEELAYLTGKGMELAAASVAKPADMGWSPAFATELAYAFLRRAATLTIAALGPVPQPYVLLATGALSRGEFLSCRKMELAIVHGGAGEYFQQFAARVSCMLPNMTCVARSLAESLAFFDGILLDPIRQGAFVSRHWFDFTAVCGDALLAGTLRQHILARLKEDRVFLAVMSNDMTSSLPPLTVYGDTVVGLDGERREDLDLRRSVIHPLVDVGRFLALSQGQLEISGTAQRLLLGARLYPEKSDIFRQAMDAFRAAVWLEFRNGGALVAPNLLDAYDRSRLKAVFRSVHALLEFVCEVEEARFA